MIKARQYEYEKMCELVKSYINTLKSNIIHITGVPGSGKTFTLNEALKTTDHIFINCNDLKKKKLIFTTILSKFRCGKKTKEKDIKGLKKHFLNCKEPHIIVIDEVDLLFNLSQSLLYNVYSLPHDEGVSLLLITVSNTFDFDLDAKIQSRIGKNIMRYVPYTSEQLLEILGQKKTKKLVQNELTTKELISRRVASISGDARRAIRLYEECKNLDVLCAEKVITEKNTPLYKYFLSTFSIYQKALISITFEKKSIQTVYSDFCVLCLSKGIKEIDFLNFNNILFELINMSFIRIKGNNVWSAYTKEELSYDLKKFEV